MTRKLPLLDHYLTPWIFLAMAVSVAFWLGRRYFRKDMEAIDCEGQPVAATRPA